MFGLTERSRSVTGAHLRWRQAPAVAELYTRKAAHDRTIASTTERAHHTRAVAEAAALALADAERQGQWARVRSLQGAADLAAQEALEARAARVAAETNDHSQTDVITDAQRKTAQAIVDGGNPVAQDLAALVEQVLAKSAELDEWTALESENFRYQPDTLAGSVFGIRNYLPDDARTFVPLRTNQPLNAIALLTEWLRQMKERGFKVHAL